MVIFYALQVLGAVRAGFLEGLLAQRMLLEQVHMACVLVKGT